MIKLLVATHNLGKIREYKALLADLPLAVTWLDAEGITQDVEETGATFAENAILKARAYGEMTGLWTWADDSGLEVDALGGAPGVYSARFAGLNATDQDRYLRLLSELRAYPPPWTARFRCVVAIATPAGALHLADGALEGMISEQPAGQHGFGYDPVFFLPEHGVTLAECPPEIKNTISHRAIAATRARSILGRLLANEGKGNYVS